jgi:hypothetical protein
VSFTTEVDLEDLRREYNLSSIESLCEPEAHKRVMCITLCSITEEYAHRAIDFMKVRFKFLDFSELRI